MVYPEGRDRTTPGSLKKREDYKQVTSFYKPDLYNGNEERRKVDKMTFIERFFFFLKFLTPKDEFQKHSLSSLLLLF